MTIEKIKQNLAASIEKPEAGVIALSGNWGTGKTYLWNQHQKNSNNPHIQNAIYVSLFGVRTINDLKIKLLAAWVEGSDNKKNISSIISESFAALGKIIKGIHHSAKALDDIALLSIPRILHDRFIVLDDIERKHKLLEIDEVLGFIDEFTMKHKTRFLLILNIDKLNDKAIWDQFREKVIHSEITFEITANEAFDVALASTSLTTYAVAIKKANQIIGITNIRVLSKTISFIENLFKNHINLEREVQERLIPSVVLLSALHYKAIPDGPTIDYVLSFNSLEDREDPSSKNNNDNIKHWSKLMRQLGLYKSEHFEQLVAIALKTQVFDYENLDNIIRDFQHPARRNSAKKRCHEFLDDYRWDTKKTNATLCNEAKDMLDIVEHMDIDAISALCPILSYIDQSGIENDFIQQWIARHNLSPEESLRLIKYNENNKIPPAILEHLNAVANKMTLPTLELADAIMNESFVVTKDAISNFIHNASIEDYVEMLNCLDKENFKKTIDIHLNWIRYDAPTEVWANNSVNKFIEACHRIVKETPDSRLAVILRRTVLNAIASQKPSQFKEGF